MLFTQAIPQKRTFILSVTQKIPPESLTNRGRIFNIENAKKYTLKWDREAELLWRAGLDRKHCSADAHHRWEE